MKLLFFKIVDENYLPTNEFSLYRCGYSYIKINIFHFCP